MMQEKRLSKTLAAAGVASRREAENLIFMGRVKVNGQTIKKPETHVNAETDHITVDGDPIRIEDKKVYFILNKPRGTICSNKPMMGKRLVVDIFSRVGLRVFTVGRLDRDTTGLLIVTNDGHFANSVIHPSSNIKKEYLVKVREGVTHEHLITISKGAFVEGIYVKPVSVVKIRHGTLKIIVKEGKKREVRKFVQKAGLTLIELKRIRIGGLRLGDVGEGHYRELSERERELIFQN